jgi:hypothetical protein
VECRLVIPVKLVKKVMLEVPNAPVATPVNRVRVLMVCAKHVQLVNLVNPMTILLILARHANRVTIKKIWAKRLVYHVYRERMKTTLLQPNVKIAALDNTKMHLGMTLV